MRAAAAPDVTVHAKTGATPRGKLLVLGNGPSLRGVDFARFHGVATLGMNAAYRYWDRIGWRPTHYACLDDALIDTHHEAIAALMRENRIETAFLSGRYLDHHPDAAQDPRFAFLDSFVPYWHEQRGAAHGLALIASACFETSDPSKLTTGAYAVRYGAHLGYDEIGLIGVDLKYAPLQEAAPVEGLRLTMTSTPASNPNYFFDDYQRSGDVFHVANPTEHDGDLHAQSFRVLRSDFLRAGLPVRLWNTAPQSLLATTGVLPHRPLARFLAEAPISAVVVPLTARERDQALDNLWLWSQPGFHPHCGPPPRDRPALVFIFNNDEAAAMEPALAAAFESSPALQRCFSELRFENLRLSGAADVYERDDTKPVGPQGRRAGPNNLFFGGLAKVSERAGHVLWMETDCTPIRAGWLDRAGELVSTGETAWVIGSLYRGGSPLGANEKRHINGNALYAAGDPEFRAFLEDVWRPSLDRMVARRPELAFDCVIESLFSAADSMRPGHAGWRTMQAVAHRFRYSDFVHNIVDNAPSLAAKAAQLARILREHPDAYLVHSRRIARAVAALRAAGVEPEPYRLIEIMTSDGDSAAAQAQQVITAEPAPPRRPGVRDFLRWSNGVISRKPEWASALAAGAGLFSLAVLLLAPVLAAPMFLLGAVAGLAALGLLAFVYLSSWLIDAIAAAERERLAQDALSERVEALEAQLKALHRP